jgi:hydroxymethylpyrimidine pyrophosphatase-like HAD family hydrolase
MQLNSFIIDENNMGFIPSSGATFQLNETGKEILTLIKDGVDKDTIVETLSKKYNIDEKEIFIDVSDFLSKLKIYGFEV